MRTASSAPNLAVRRFLHYTGMTPALQ